MAARPTEPGNLKFSSFLDDKSISMILNMTVNQRV
jgi:hypothetical protein